MSAYVEEYIEWCNLTDPPCISRDLNTIQYFARSSQHLDTPQYVEKVLRDKFLSEPVQTGPSDPWMDEGGIMTDPWVEYLRGIHIAEANDPILDS